MSFKDFFRITGINIQTGAIARCRTAVLTAGQIIEAADRKTFVADFRVAEIECQLESAVKVEQKYVKIFDFLVKNLFFL
jgi:hypothetical protein